MSAQCDLSRIPTPVLPGKRVEQYSQYHFTKFRAENDDQGCRYLSSWTISWLQIG